MRNSKTRHFETARGKRKQISRKSRHFEEKVGSLDSLMRPSLLLYLDELSFP